MQKPERYAVKATKVDAENDARDRLPRDLYPPFCPYEGGGPCAADSIFRVLSALASPGGPPLPPAVSADFERCRAQQHLWADFSNVLSEKTRRARTGLLVRQGELRGVDVPASGAIFGATMAGQHLCLSAAANTPGRETISTVRVKFADARFFAYRGALMLQTWSPSAVYEIGFSPSHADGGSHFSGVECEYAPDSVASLTAKWWTKIHVLHSPPSNGRRPFGLAALAVDNSRPEQTVVVVATREPDTLVFYRMGDVENVLGKQGKKTNMKKFCVVSSAVAAVSDDWEDVRIVIDAGSRIWMGFHNTLVVFSEDFVQLYSNHNFLPFQLLTPRVSPEGREFACTPRAIICEAQVERWLRGDSCVIFDDAVSGATAIDREPFEDQGSTFSSGVASSTIFEAMRRDYELNFGEEDNWGSTFELELNFERDLLSALASERDLPSAPPSERK